MIDSGGLREEGLRTWAFGWASAAAQDGPPPRPRPAEGPPGCGLLCGAGLAGGLQSQTKGGTPQALFQPTRLQLVPMRRVSDGPLQTGLVFNSF